MAKTSAIGYITAARQTLGLNTPRTDDASNAWTITDPLVDPAGMFFRYLSSPTASAAATNNRFREGGGGRDVTLSLKEGITHNVDFSVFARPVAMGYLWQSLTGPAAVGAVRGGGTRSNAVYRPPDLIGGAGNTTTNARIKAGDLATVVPFVSDTGFAAAEGLVCGWGANMEFHLIASDGPLILTTPWQFPHNIGEPVYSTEWGQVTADVDIGATTLTVEAVIGTGITDGPTKFGILYDNDATVKGNEFGSAEEFTGTLASNVITAIAASGLVGIENEHSIGAIVYPVDDAITSAVHTFEPVSGLASSVDYFTVERSASGQVFERVQDCKMSTFELSGESPAAITCNVSFMGRFGAVQTSAEAVSIELYPNQDPATDLPFRMVDGEYNILFGSSNGISSSLRQFSWNASNIVADDIFTDSITRDDILDLARESNFSCQFYFDTAAEYYETFYGEPTPSAGSTPSTVATSGSILLEWVIDVNKRMNIYIPQVVWEAYPVEIDPEPKPIIVDAVGVPLKSGTAPLYLASVQNADTLQY